MVQRMIAQIRHLDHMEERALIGYDTESNPGHKREWLRLLAEVQQERALLEATLKEITGMVVGEDVLI